MVAGDGQRVVEKVVPDEPKVLPEVLDGMTVVLDVTKQQQVVDVANRPDQVRDVWIGTVVLAAFPLALRA